MEEQKKKKSKKRLSFLIGLMLLILAAMVIVQIVKSFFTFEEFTPTIRNSVGLIEVNDQILNSVLINQLNEIVMNISKIEMKITSSKALQKSIINQIF